MAKILCPIVVIGPPRSGTSFTAKILVQYLGVRMGTSYNPLSKIVGHIVYEDNDLVALNSGFNDDQITENEWKEGMVEFFDKMKRLDSPWGFKDPRVARGLDWIINYFQKKLTIVRCQRERKLVLKSMKKKLGIKKKQAENLIDNTDKLIDEALIRNSMPFIFIEYKKKHYDPLKVANFLSEALLSA